MMFKYFGQELSSLHVYLQIGEYVGTRNQDECLLYFMRLPIIERMTDTDIPQVDDVIPFGRSSNPVAYTMSFLASVIEPRVAACAAKAALGKLHY